MTTTIRRPTEVPAEAVPRPHEPTAEELALATSGASTSEVSLNLEKPLLEPPGSPRAALVAAEAGAGWLTNRHVLMLWQTTGAMDAWAFLDGGTGWRRLTQASDVATRGIDLLVAGARVSGGIVQTYEGTSGTIDAIYLW